MLRGTEHIPGIYDKFVSEMKYGFRGFSVTIPGKLKDEYQQQQRRWQRDDNDD